MCVLMIGLFHCTLEGRCPIGCEGGWRSGSEVQVRSGVGIGPWSRRRGSKGSIVA